MSTQTATPDVATRGRGVPEADGHDDSDLVEVRLPPVGGRFDYQLGGAYRPASSVRIVGRDRTAGPVPGVYSICYVNAFQSPPEDSAFWAGSRSDLLVRSTDGLPVEDPDWPGEFLLDTSTAARRVGVATVVDGWIDDCAQRGFQAVEPDNLDSWTRSHGALTMADNVAMATLLVAHAHSRGLAVAQKNTIELGSAGRNQVGFDFAIVEECQVYAECDGYTRVYGDQVIEIEYTDNPWAAYIAACTARGARVPVILRDRDVVPRGHSGYHYDSC